MAEALVKVIPDWNGGGIIKKVNLRLRRKLEKNTFTVPILMPASGICSIIIYPVREKNFKTRRLKLVSNPCPIEDWCKISWVYTTRAAPLVVSVLLYLSL